VSTSVYDGDAAKLRVLADWFDEQDRKPGARVTGDEVQQDLRRIADYLSRGRVIGRKSYARLIEDQDKLNALEQAGVDNWDGYSHAIQILNGTEENW
jgi:hypothetical protein